MKKLLLAGGIALLLASCKPKNSQTSGTSQPSATESTQSLPEMTLDGRSKVDAGILVDNLIDDNTSSDKRTNIWFSDKWVHEITLLLQKEKTIDATVDGFRVYFAKEANGKNTLVIVSTREIGDNANAPSKKNHQDYSGHDSHFLDTLRQNTNSVNYLIDYHTLINSVKGTRLYESSTPCDNASSCIITEFNHEIKCTDAYKYVNNFKGKKSINVISEWFPLSLLEALDDELNAAKAAHTPSDGIRFYFARKTKHNAVIVVTTQNINGSHIDYYNCFKPNNTSSAVEDHGEECPLNCSGLTWPDPDPED